MQTNTGDDVRKGMEDKLLTMSEHVKKVKSACKSKKKAKHSSAAPNKANQTDVHSEKSVPANAESEKDAITSGSQVETKDLKEKSSNANESNGEDATEPKIPQKKTPANDLDTSSVEVEAKKPGGKICKRPEDSPVKPGESLLKTSSEKPPMVVSPLKINRIECVSGLNKGKQIFVIKKRKDKETINSESPKKFKDIHN